MNASTSSLPPARVTPDPWRAFGGIWRLTFRRMLQPTHWLAVGGMLAMLVLIALASFPRRSPTDAQFFDWVLNFYLLFIVPVLAFISAGGTIRDDLKSTTVDYVFTRPVRRPLFIAFKYLSHLACAQLDFLLSLVLVAGIGAAFGVGSIWAALPMLLLGQGLLVIVFSAFGFLSGIITSRYILLGLVYGSAIELGVGQIPTQISRLSMSHQVRTMVEPWLKPMASVESGPFSVIFMILLVSLIMLGAGAALFSYRELSGPES